MIAWLQSAAADAAAVAARTEPVHQWTSTTTRATDKHTQLCSFSFSYISFLHFPVLSVVVFRLKASAAELTSMLSIKGQSILAD